MYLFATSPRKTDEAVCVGLAVARIQIKSNVEESKPLSTL